MPDTIHDLLHRLRSVEPTSPRLTWYGPGSERVELSGRVLDNWVAKTANFLSEELDAGPGTRVLLDLPAHWRGLCWALAVWQCGATARFAGTAAPGEPDVVATADPAGAPAAGLTVAVALGALELRWRGPLPAGAIDYAGEVRSFADVFFPAGETPSGTRAVDGGADYAGLLSEFAVPAGPERTLVRAGTLQAAAARCLGVWAAGGSVVLVHPDVGAGPDLLSSERITAS
ncbi:MAG: TIGR03089 family protein [Actinomycetales bacterium]